MALSKCSRTPASFSSSVFFSASSMLVNSDLLVIGVNCLDPLNLKLGICSSASSYLGQNVTFWKFLVPNLHNLDLESCTIWCPNFSYVFELTPFAGEETMIQLKQNPTMNLQLGKQPDKFS